MLPVTAVFGTCQNCGRSTSIRQTRVIFQKCSPCFDIPVDILTLVYVHFGWMVVGMWKHPHGFCQVPEMDDAFPDA